MLQRTPLPTPEDLLAALKWPTLDGRAFLVPGRVNGVRKIERRLKMIEVKFE